MHSGLFCSLHHVPRLPGVGYPISGFHGKLKASQRLCTAAVLSGASIQAIGACIERIVWGESVLIKLINAEISGSLAGAFPGEKDVSREASRIDRAKTGSAHQFEVGKFRLRSTPLALPRVPKVIPSGFAHSTKATDSNGCPKERSTRLKRNVVSGSSPWIPAITSNRHLPLQAI